MDSYAIEHLIASRRAALGISRGEIARRLGFANTNKALRRLDALCDGDLHSTRFLIAMLPNALELPAAEVHKAIQATADQIAETERKRAEDEERAYRATFRPHVILTTERLVPWPIFAAAIIGVETILRLDLDWHLLPTPSLTRHFAYCPPASVRSAE